MMLDNNLLHTDILKKLNRLKKPQRHLPKTIKIERSTIYRIGIGKPITMKTFLILLDWLNKDANRYIKKTNNKSINYL